MTFAFGLAFSVGDSPGTIASADWWGLPSHTDERDEGDLLESRTLAGKKGECLPAVRWG